MNLESTVAAATVAAQIADLQFGEPDYHQFGEPDYHQFGEPEYHQFGEPVHPMTPQLDLASPTYRDELKAIFRRIDEDGNGSLDAREIKGALSTAGLPSPTIQGSNTWTTSEIQVIISDCDPEGVFPQQQAESD